MGYRAMKYVRAWTFIAAFLALSPALAQWQVPNHAVPQGRGSGVQGYGSAGPGAAGLPFVGNGPSADGSFQALGYAGGGTAATTQTTARNNIFPTPTRAGDVAYWSGTAWVTLAGNNSGSNCFGENASGLPSWVACSGGGTPGGTPGQIQYNNAGSFGGFTPGTGVQTALGVNIGSAGAFTTFNGAAGTPSSITLTNGTGLPTTGLTGTLQAAQEPAHTGDVANTAGSLALTIQPNAVTNAKQATMTANTIKANATSGAAVPADVAVSSCSGVQNFLQWLTNTGPQCGTAPSWTIASGTVSAQATTTITVSGSPNTIELFIEQLDVSSAGSDIWLRLNGDAAANYQFAYNIVGTAGTVSGAGAAAQGFCKVIPNVKAGFGARATVTLNAPLNVAITKHMTLRSANTDNTTATLSSLVGSCFWNSSAAITSVTILPSAGTASFLYQMVGYK